MNSQRCIYNCSEVCNPHRLANLHPLTHTHTPGKEAGLGEHKVLPPGRGGPQQLSYEQQQQLWAVQAGEEDSVTLLPASWDQVRPTRRKMAAPPFLLLSPSIRGTCQRGKYLRSFFRAVWTLHLSPRLVIAREETGCESGLVQDNICIQAAHETVVRPQS